jgi:uroporphyrin-III C-methyltransferase/precorrin-2 dehydrogenase/sirohydrochlorin ferrochelatase/uroporphyrin-III C-methyltransferase
MSSETLDGVVANLLKNNISDDKLLAVVEQATTPMQNVHTCRLIDYQKKLGAKLFASPTLVIIGKVVALHEKFSWLKNNTDAGEYFKPDAEVQFKQMITDSMNIEILK